MYMEIVRNRNQLGRQIFQAVCRNSGIDLEAPPIRTAPEIATR